jgi:hypothetical protein
VTDGWDVVEPCAVASWPVLMERSFLKNTWLIELGWELVLKSCCKTVFLAECVPGDGLWGPTYWGLGSWDCYSQKIVKSVVKFWIHSVDRFLTKKRHLLNRLSSRFDHCSSNVDEMLWSPWKSWIGAHDHSTKYGLALGLRNSAEKTSKIENTQSHVVESVDAT